MGQPRRNEKRFYRYPLHRIVAVVDDAPNLGLALADLGTAGYDVSKVNVLSGPQGAMLLDPTGVRHGLATRPVLALAPGVRLRDRRPWGPHRRPGQRAARHVRAGQGRSGAPACAGGPARPGRAPPAPLPQVDDRGSPVNPESRTGAR